jgi:hypothetical protein
MLPPGSDCPSTDIHVEKGRFTMLMRVRSSALLILAASICLSVAVAGCGDSDNTSPSRLSSANINLIFVVSQDLGHNDGDIDLDTANLNTRGLQRVISLATYLHSTLLNQASVNGIYVLEPATHLQTANNYPDLVPLEAVEQFAVLNQYSIDSPTPAPAATFSFSSNSFPINVCYTRASVPQGVSTPSTFFANCQGIDFADNGGDNETLVNGIIAQQQGGFYVFALPFETLQSLLNNVKTLNSYDYTVPVTWEGANTLYVLTIPLGGPTTLTTHDTQIHPATTYPIPVPTPQSTSSSMQAPFEIQTLGLQGSSVPANINTNETVYFIRHGEAHPTSYWEDGNLVYPGNVRALYLPIALAGNPNITTPDFVYAVDPAQFIPGGIDRNNVSIDDYSYVRTSQTVAPYAIANGIPFYVASGFQWGGLTSQDEAAAVDAAVSYFFTGGRFSNKTLLICWEHDHIPRIAQALVDIYFAPAAPTIPPVPQASSSWPANDYDTIWTFSLDGSGNLTLHNHFFEGISTDSLPKTP